MKRSSLRRQLVISHLLLAIAITGIVWFTFVMERNRTISELLTNRWAAPLLQAQHQPQRTLPAGLHWLSTPVRRQPLLQYAPRNWMLKQALQQQGVQVGNIQVNPQRLDELWVELTTITGVQWLALESPLVKESPKGRLLIGMLLTLLSIAGLSWWNIRRLAQPLALIEKAIDRKAAVPALPAGSAKEIDLIANRYNELRESEATQAAERNLLLAGVSHDLRSPLARIKMAASLLPVSADTEAKLAIISRNVDVADQLIGSFMDYVRAGSEPLSDEVCLDSVIHTIRDLYREQPLVEIDVGTGENLLHRPLAHVNDVLLVRLLQNLIDNGLKHGKPPVVLSIQSINHQPVLSVIDHGSGIPAAEADQLWQAFARGDSSRHAPGTGLGLAIVKQIADRFDATIETKPVTTPIGQGWCCQLKLSFAQSGKSTKPPRVSD